MELLGLEPRLYFASPSCKGGMLIQLHHSSNCVLGRNRTYDLFHVTEALFQLSHENIGKVQGVVQSRSPIYVYTALRLPYFERMIGIEPTSEGWKPPTLAIVLHSHLVARPYNHWDNPDMNVRAWSANIPCGNRVCSIHLSF